jgi:proteasome accessory factor B
MKAKSKRAEPRAGRATGPGSGPQLHARPPLERMMRIHQAIATGEYPNATTLAAEIEVTTKTIHRDIEFMRDRLQLPIEYDGRKYGYHYTEEVSAFPTLQITEGELVALLVAEKALQQYRGTNFEKPLLSAGRWRHRCRIPCR